MSSQIFADDKTFKRLCLLFGSKSGHVTTLTEEHISEIQFGNRGFRKLSSQPSSVQRYIAKKGNFSPREKLHQAKRHYSL